MTSQTRPVTDLKLALSDLADDAPSDGNQYAREDGAWTQVTSHRGVGVWVQIGTTWYPFEPTSADLEIGDIRIKK